MGGSSKLKEANRKRAERRKRQMERMTPEQRKEFHLKQNRPRALRNAAKPKRKVKTAEERLESKRICNRRWSRNRTPEQKKNASKRSVDGRRRRYAAMTIEEREEHRIREKEKLARRIALMSNEKRKEYFRKRLERCRRWRSKLTADQRLRIKAANKKYYAERWNKMSEEERREERRKRHLNYLKSKDRYDPAILRARKIAYWQNLPRRIKMIRQAVQNSRRSRATQKCYFCEANIQKYGMRQHLRLVHQTCSNLRVVASEIERRQIEERTREGSKSADWRQARRGVITATRAHRVVRRRIAPVSKIVGDFMHTSGTGRKTYPMERGLDLEPSAVILYQVAMQLSDMKFQYPVGLMVHPDVRYLAATPDALIGDDGCLEVKSPMSCLRDLAQSQTNKFILHAKPGEGGKFLWSTSGQRGRFKLNRRCPYFTQVVMEIMCCNRKYCDFVVYFVDDYNPDNWELWFERISRDEAESAWKWMSKKLTSFFCNHMGPYSPITQ